MQRIGVIGVLSLGLIGVAPLAQAADVDKAAPEPKAPAAVAAPATAAPEPQAPMTTAPAKTAVVEGLIKSVDLRPEALALVVTPRSGQPQLVTWVSGGVTVWRNDRPVSLEQLSAGEWVKIETEFQNGQWMAKKILIQAVPAAAPSTASHSSKAY